MRRNFEDKNENYTGVDQASFLAGKAMTENSEKVCGDLLVAPANNHPSVKLVKRLVRTIKTKPVCLKEKRREFFCLDHADYELLGR